MTKTTTEIAARISRLSDRVETTVANVAPDVWQSPSPCEGWTARDLLSHLIDVHGMMLRHLDRTLGPAPSVADNPLGAFQAARADVAAVLADPDLAATEYDSLFGRARVQDTIDAFLGFDLIVHGWDLARATGQDTTIPHEEVEWLWAKARDLGDALRSPGVCKEPVELGADASPQDRVLAFLGRDPR